MGQTVPLVLCLLTRLLTCQGVDQRASLARGLSRGPAPLPGELWAGPGWCPGTHQECCRSREEESPKQRDSSVGWFMALQWPGAWGDPEVPAVDLSPQGECARMERDRGMAELEGAPGIQAELLGCDSRAPAGGLACTVDFVPMKTKAVGRPGLPWGVCRLLWSTCCGGRRRGPSRSSLPGQPCHLLRTGPRMSSLRAWRQEAQGPGVGKAGSSEASLLSLPISSCVVLLCVSVS